MNQPTEQVIPDSAGTLATEAAILRGGATRLARRLRSERPDGALSTDRISLMSHLARRGNSTMARIAEIEHHQTPEMLARAERDLLAAGMIARTPNGELAITESGEQALAEDGPQRDIWLIDVLANMSEQDRQLLRAAGRLMTEIAHLPGRYQHVPTESAG